MKKSHYIFGTILICTMLIGMIFKINHWPTAGIILTGSLGVFALIFLPIAFISSLKEVENQSIRIFYIAALIISMINVVGMILVIMHWPGTSIFIVVGILSIPAILIPSLFLGFRDEFRANTKTLIYVLFFIIYIAVMDVFLSLGSL